MVSVSNPSTSEMVTVPPTPRRPTRPGNDPLTTEPLQDYCLIPTALQTLPQWLVWRTEMRNGKPSKVPYDANTGDKGKSNDPATWCDFVTAINTVHQNTRYAGIGFAFRAGDGLTGIDVDYPWDHPVAVAIRVRFHGTYCEQSPNGKLRIFCYGKPLRCGKGTEDKKLEIYDHTSPRYLTVTGRHIAGTAKEVTEQQAALVAFHEAYFKPREPSNHSLPVIRITERQDDQALIDRATQAKNGGKFATLYYSGRHDSHDPSAADFALCSLLAFYTQDLQQLDRLFRQSALFRPKWDERHYSDGRTYGQATIQKALVSGYRPASREPRQSLMGHSTTPSKNDKPPLRGENDSTSIKSRVTEVTRVTSNQDAGLAVTSSEIQKVTPVTEKEENAILNPWPTDPVQDEHGSTLVKNGVTEVTLVTARQNAGFEVTSTKCQQVTPVTEKEESTILNLNLWPTDPERPCYRVYDDWQEVQGQPYRPGVYFHARKPTKKDTVTTLKVSA